MPLNFEQPFAFSVLQIWARGFEQLVSDQVKNVSLALQCHILQTIDLFIFLYLSGLIHFFTSFLVNFRKSSTQYF